MLEYKKTLHINGPVTTRDVMWLFNIYLLIIQIFTLRFLHCLKQLLSNKLKLGHMQRKRGNDGQTETERGSEKKLKQMWQMETKRGKADKWKSQKWEQWRTGVGGKLRLRQQMDGTKRKDQGSEGGEEAEKSILLRSVEETLGFNLSWNHCSGEEFLFVPPFLHLKFPVTHHTDAADLHLRLCFVIEFPSTGGRTPQGIFLFVLIGGIKTYEQRNYVLVEWRGWSQNLKRDRLRWCNLQY